MSKFVELVTAALKDEDSDEGAIKVEDAKSAEGESETEDPSPSEESEVESKEEEGAQEEKEESSESSESSDDEEEDDEDEEDSEEDSAVDSWKKRSRMWEKRAKARASEVEALKAELAEVPSLKEKLQSLEDAEAQRALEEAKANIASELGLPLEVVKALKGSEEDVRAAAVVIKTAGLGGSTKKPIPALGSGSKVEKTSLKEILEAALKG